MQVNVVCDVVQRAYMEFTPLLAVQVLAALVAIIASSYVRRIIKSFLMLQKIKQYSGTSRLGSASTAYTMVLCRPLRCHQGFAVTFRA